MIDSFNDFFVNLVCPTRLFFTTSLSEFTSSRPPNTEAFLDLGSVFLPSPGISSVYPIPLVPKAPFLT